MDTRPVLETALWVAPEIGAVLKASKLGKVAEVEKLLTVESARTTNLSHDIQKLDDAATLNKPTKVAHDAGHLAQEVRQTENITSKTAEATRSAKTEVQAAKTAEKGLPIQPNVKLAEEVMTQGEPSGSQFALKRSKARSGPEPVHIERPPEKLKPALERTPDEWLRINRETSETVAVRMQQKIAEAQHEIGTPEFGQWAKQHPDQAEAKLKRLEELETFAARQRPITYLKEMPAPESYARNGLDQALHDAGLTKEQFDELRLTRQEELSAQQIQQMKLVRDRAPQIDKDTLIQKAIPMDTVDAMLNATMNTNPKAMNVGGFVSRYDDVKHLKGFDETFESLRLDYSGSPYKPNQPYGIIRYKASNIKDIEPGYSQIMGGTTNYPPPCTKNGFLAGRNGETIAEYKAPYGLPKDGAQLIIVKNGQETLVATYSEAKGHFVREIPKE